MKGWYDEGQGKIERVGKRYGLWQDDLSGSKVVTTGEKTAGEGVANAISAYVLVKVSRTVLSSRRGKVKRVLADLYDRHYFHSA